MRIHAVFLVLLLLLLMILTVGCTGPITPSENRSVVTPTVTSLPVNQTPSSAETLVAFVEKAYEYAKVHGKEASLAEFNDPKGRFVQGELYIFAYDMAGNCLALPFQLDLVGTNRWNTTDYLGNYPIRENIQAALSGGNFVHYSYPDPSDNNTVKPKLAFSMLVDKDWIIGSGIYDPDLEDPYVRMVEDPEIRNDLTSFVREAIAYARQKGREEALREFNNRNGTFFRGALYIFAFDYNMTNLAIPIRPEFVGTDRSGSQDALGINFTRIENYVAQEGGGFVFYRYPNPVHNMTVEPKMSYISPVDKTWWLGSGIYLG